MALYRINDFFPDYYQEFGGQDLKRYTVYAGTTEARIGFIQDVLVDDDGNFRYFVVETGFWIFGKKVLLPTGQALIDSEDRCIYAIGLKSIKQAENLPEYHNDLVVDFDYEQSVCIEYRIPNVDAGKCNQDTYSYDTEPELFQLQETDSGNTIKLYQERLISNKQRQKLGAVSIGTK